MIMLRPIYIMLFSTVFLAAQTEMSAQTKSIIKYQEREKQTTVVMENGKAFIPVRDIVSILNCKIFENPEKKKTVLTIDSRTLKLTAFSPFIVMDDKDVIQMADAAVWREQSLWIPAAEFLPVISRLLPGPLQWNGQTVIAAKETADKQTISKDSVLSERYNLRSVAWSKKRNGYLITLSTEKEFQQEELAVWRNKQWLYLTVSGGLPAPNVSSEMNELTRSGFIRKALVFQHQKSVQLSFQLIPEIEGHELMNESSRKQIHLVIRTPVTGNQQELKKDTVRKQNVKQDDKRWVIDKIVIDAGHGGKDPGAVGKGGTKEKTVTLAIALKLGKLFGEKTNVKVAYTRTTDEFISLKDRTKFANNQNAKLFVSIHCNASKKRSAAGFETFFLSPSRNDEAQAVAMLENEAIQYEENRHEYGDFTNEKFILANMMQSVFVKESEELADYVQKGLAKKMTFKNRGVSQGPFYVLMGASMPSILVEAAFISNKSEEKYLNSQAGQQAIAEGIFQGLKYFIESYR